MDKQDLVYVLFEDRDVSFRKGSSPVARGIIGIFSTERHAISARNNYPGDAIVVEYEMNKIEIGV